MEKWRVRVKKGEVGRVRKYGDFFEEVTGKKASDCASILDVEKEVEKKLKHKLELKSFSSNFVPRHGNVLPLSRNDIEAIDKELDALLKKAS